MESGAILIYLADKTGKLMPKSGDGRYKTIEWLMWQMGGPGPMFGQVHHFVKYNPGKAPYAEERYLKEAHRLYGVLDKRLADREYVADAYSIADIAIWPWVSRYEWQTVDLNTVSQRQALVHGDRQAPGDPERLQGAQRRRRSADAVSARGVVPWGGALQRAPTAPCRPRQDWYDHHTPCRHPSRLAAPGHL